MWLSQLHNQNNVWCGKDRTDIRFVFEISNFRMFSRYTIRNSKIRSYINEYRSNIFLHVLRRKIGPGRSLTFWLNYEKLQPSNYSSHILYEYTHKTPFSILIEFEAIVYLCSIRYSIRIRNFEDIRFDIRFEWNSRFVPSLRRGHTTRLLGVI